MSTSRLSDRFEALVDYASRPRWLVGASLFRVMVGATILLQYLLNWEQRRYLFGPDGAFAFDDFCAGALERKFSLFQLSASPAWFEVVYHAGIGAALVWMLGFGTRWITPILWLLWISLHERFPVLWDGGDNLISIALVYAMFADLSQRFTARAPRPPPSATAAVVHNAAMLAILVQVCVVYTVAGLTKVQGESWRSGTALYQALNSTHGWAGHGQFVWRNGVILTLISYFTVALQVSFPFLVAMNRWTRVAVVGVAVTMHVGIAIYLGLVSFAAFMIAADLALIGDEEYEALARWVQSMTRPRIAAILNYSSPRRLS